MTGEGIPLAAAMRALVLVVYDENDWQRRGLPLRKAFRRQVIKFSALSPSY
ncbi:hypothetical protein NKI88_07085 [Mesorhizobium sp. M0317]|uniref:hypothetical protein n=1 Tax=Mesorhizobium sp. M0317 TaxID=2956935 RepID=UPI003339376B